MSHRIAFLRFALLAWGLFATSCCFSVPLFAQVQSWVQLQDPSPEHGFALDVPKGWAAKAGMFRLGYSDVRLVVDLKSPDGKTNVRLGDVSIPAYALPTPTHPREGDFIDLGAQAQLTVANYRTGQQYAEKYAQIPLQGTLQEPDAGRTRAVNLDTRQLAARPRREEFHHRRSHLPMRFRFRSDDHLCLCQDEPR